jgi:hypothetical protein
MEKVSSGYVGIQLMYTLNVSCVFFSVIGKYPERELESINQKNGRIKT